jgi:hypothetical protein
MSKIEFVAIAEILSDAAEEIVNFKNLRGPDLSAEEIRQYIGHRLEIVLAERAGPGGFDAARFRSAARLFEDHWMNGRN